MSGSSVRGTRRSIVGVVVVALVLVACGSNGDDPDEAQGPSQTTAQGTDGEETAGEPVEGGDITVRQITDVTSMDPISGNSGFDQQTLYPIYDRLVNQDPETLEPTPGLARSWEFEDPTTLVLTLQEGVQFHDGTPFDAEAVKVNLDRAVTLETSTVKQDVAMIESVEVRSPTEVQINLNRPDTSLINILSDRAGMMVSPEAAADPAALAENPVGAGPFTFVEWLPGDRLVLEKNEDYWQDGKPYLDRITFRFITPAETARNALQAGEVDVALQMSSTDVQALEGNDDLEISVHPSLFLAHCYFNFSKPPFDRVEARQAVNLAIDREALNEAYTFGLGEPAHEAFPPGYWAYQEDLGEAFEYDPDRARELLTDAGLENMSITGVTTTSTDFGRLNEIVQAQLAEVGIEMTFEQQEPAAATSSFFEDLEQNIYCSAWSGRPDATQTARSLFGVPSFFNAGGYDAPGMAEAIDASAAAEDIDSRAEAFNEVIAISQDEALHVPLVHVPNVDAFAGNIQGFTPTLGKADVSFVWLEE